MRCEGYRKLLPEYVEGGLRASVRRDMESHIESCDGCRNEVERWHELRGLVARAPLPGDGPNEPDWNAFETRVLAHAREHANARRPVTLGMLIPSGVMAAVAGIVWLVSGVGGAPGETSPARVEDTRSMGFAAREAVPVSTSIDLAWEPPFSWSVETLVEDVDSGVWEEADLLLATYLAESPEDAVWAVFPEHTTDSDLLSEVETLDADTLAVFYQRLEAGVHS